MSKLLSAWFFGLAWPGLSLLGAEKPVWVASNGFHSSLGLRAADVPFARQITGDTGADELLIGWGAYDYYQGKTNLWTLIEAILPNWSVLHVVPVHGPIAERFSHSDVIRLEVSPEEFGLLLRQIDAAFELDAQGRRIPTGHPGFYPDSRFYLGRETFYFPNMCNLWVAAKLRRSGLPLHPLDAITAPELVRQVQPLGRQEATLKTPHDAF